LYVLFKHLSYLFNLLFILAALHSSHPYPDCCATYSAERHLAACQSIAGYCRQRTLDVLLEEFLAVTGAKPPPSGTGGPPGGTDGVTGNNTGVTSGGGPSGGGQGVTGGGGVTRAMPGVTGGPGVIGVTGLAGVMRGVTPLGAGDGVTGSHQLGGLGDVAAGMGVTGVTSVTGPPGMLVGEVMPAGGGLLMDGSMNGGGSSYKRGVFGPSMVYGNGTGFNLASLSAEAAAVP
jgi:hypothetical protein